MTTINSRGFLRFCKSVRRTRRQREKKSTMMVLLYIYSKISGVRLPICPVISKNLNKNIICTMDDVRGDFLGPPHDTTPGLVIANKI